MPNWPLNCPAKRMLLEHVYTLADRPSDYVKGEFPLTPDQIQHMVLSEHHLSTMRKLEQEGITTIERHGTIRLLFRRDTFPGLRRHAIMWMILPRGIFVPRNTTGRIDKTNFGKDETRYIVPRVEALDVGDKARITEWVNKMTRQTRLREITRVLAATIIENHAPTAAHLRAFWPTIATVFHGVKQQSTHHRRLEASDWAERFRNLPKHTSAYTPDPAVRARFAPFMPAADSVLLSAMLLEPYKRVAGASTLDIEHWEKRPGDPVVPK
jgi:hypothetical protein